MKNTKGIEEEIEKLRIRALERQSLELLKKSHWGRIYAAMYFFIGVGSILVYALIFELNIILSIFLGIVTWFLVATTADKILIKTSRIDKQLDWFFKTPEGLAELKRKGIADEQIEKMKSEIEKNSLYKKLTLDK